MSVFLLVSHEKWPLPKKVCVSVCLFYSPFLKRSVCLSRKRNTFQEGSSLTHLNPTLITLIPPAGPVRHHKSWALKAGIRHGICQIFYTSKISNFVNFTWEKRVNRDLFGQKLRMDDVFLIYFEKNCQFSCNYLLTQIQTHSIFLPRKGNFLP